MSRPNTKPARRARIAELLQREAIPNQAVLASLLSADGLSVTQATLSRDLDELGAVKVVGPEGSLVYAIPGEGGNPAQYRHHFIRQTAPSADEQRQQQQQQNDPVKGGHGHRLQAALSTTSAWLSASQAS